MYRIFFIFPFSKTHVPEIPTLCPPRIVIKPEFISDWAAYIEFSVKFSSKFNMSLSETILSVKNSFSPNLIKTGCPKSYTYLFSFFQNIIWNLQVFWHIRKNLFLNIMHHPHLTNIIYMHLIPQIELKNRLNKKISLNPRLDA